MTDDLLIALPDLATRLERIETNLSQIRTLVGPFGVPFPDGTMLVQTIYGTKYFIDPNDMVMAPQLVVYRQWENDLSTFMINSTTSDTVFVDIGANFGYFTVLVASRIGATGPGHVIAIEPNPQSHALLRKNLRINWSIAPVTIHECAVTDARGFVELCVPSDSAANARINTASRTSPDNDHLTVTSDSLDNLINGLDVDIIKIDVEGFEALVLRGARETIVRSKCITIAMEWSQPQMRLAGFDANDLLAIFKQYGLLAYRLPPTRFLSSAQWSDFLLSDNAIRAIEYDNIILRRPG